MRRKGNPLDGVLLLDKPLGMSSNHAMLKVRRLFNAAKAGHGGTLDPLATGVLPILLGEATKFAHDSLDADKQYLATVHFGWSTTTYDREGEKLETADASALEKLDQATIENGLRRFEGAIEQIPPMYSALKKDGKALYEYAREGIELERSARSITMYELSLLSYAQHSAQIRIRCSKGTYVRSLAHDLGRSLGVPAHLSGLIRERVALADLADSLSLDRLIDMSDEQRLAILKPADSLIPHIPVVNLSLSQADALMHGQSVQLDLETTGADLRVEAPAEASKPVTVRVYCEARLLGLGVIEPPDLLKSKRLIATAQAH
jgi:tRNA pseudouridine55 synthase